jgi:hypothetical protein
MAKSLIEQSVVAKVTVSVEIPSGSCWGPDCTMKQIHDQAVTGALGKLRKALTETGIRIVGEPLVTAILADER